MARKARLGQAPKNEIRLGMLGRFCLAVARVILRMRWLMLSVFWARVSVAVPLLLILALASMGTGAERAWEVHTPGGELAFDLQTGTVYATNGIVVRYGETTLVADSAWVNQNTGEAYAQGNVRLYYKQQIWVADAVHYNFKTGQMQADAFRTGKFPVFVSAENLRGEATNGVYYATNAMVTTDDSTHPVTLIRARYIRIVPGQEIVARDAVLYAGGVPVLYLPYYRRQLDVRANNFSVTPGYRSAFGPFLLGSYNWVWGTNFDGSLRLDYRLKRGIGTGADVEWAIPWLGSASAKYYFLRDEEPERDFTGMQYPEDRHYARFGFLGMPAPNLEARAQAVYLSDAGVLREFFEGAYRAEPQPGTFAQATRRWDNFTLSAMVQPRLNDFQETVERLPEVRLTAFRQRLWQSPVYYESESSFGFLRHKFGETNGPILPYYEAIRADSYHQLTAPWTIFGWLNIIPRVGGRCTYYSEADGPGATTSEQTRWLFNTGAELTFKAWRTWPGLTNGLLQLDGLRHVLQPSINYVYVPAPNVAPWQIPQFDYAVASLLPVPLEFPDYSAVDSVDAQNVVRFGLHNRLQTRRDGSIVDFVDWSLLTDWRLDPTNTQSTFADLCSTLTLRPRSWLTLHSDVRLDTDQARFNLARQMLVIEPGPRWRWLFTYYYLRDDQLSWPAGWGTGSHLFNNTLEYRFDEDWAVRLSHYVDLTDGSLKEHSYTIYRDLRSWTAAVVFRVRRTHTGAHDYGIALTLSLKAWPRSGTDRHLSSPYSIFGG